MPNNPDSSYIRCFDDVVVIDGPVIFRTHATSGSETEPKNRL